MDTLGKPAKPVVSTPSLFDDDILLEEWREHWVDMPEFSMSDATPQRRIVVNFVTNDDVQLFAKTLGIPISKQADSIWFPKQIPLNGTIYWDGPKTDSRYPVCIPSKGRAQHQKTARALERLGVSYKFFVEECEYEEYCAALGATHIVRLPFSNLGQGSIPARNYIWEWAKENNHKRHWVVDDNIVAFVRCTNNRRLVVRGGGFFRAMEDFVDRYENIALAGPHDKAFTPDRSATLTPFLLNSRIYSCILIDTSLNYRWRGRYNEDTDLSLRVLKDGYCTVLFRALLMDKHVTVGNRNSKPLPGGNTDNVYNTGDRRLAFAKSLAEQHPDCVKVVWKWDRWHHQVNYSAFRKNKLQIRKDVTPVLSNNDYGMTLVRHTGSSTQ